MEDFQRVREGEAMHDRTAVIVERRSRQFTSDLPVPRPGWLLLAIVYLFSLGAAPRRASSTSSSQLVPPPITRSLNVSAPFARHSAG